MRRAIRPGTRATCAALLVCGALASGQQAAPAARPGELDFAVVGHLRGDATGTELGYLDELVAALRAAQPDFVVLAGDLVWGDIDAEATDVEAVRADWERLDGRLAALGVPIHRVPGNHDVNDRATRDLWIERYGALPSAVRHGDVLLCLFASAWIPADDDPRKHPQAFIRGRDLDAAQIEFLRETLAQSDCAHAFLFGHHVLWWEAGAAWWRDVHPLLARFPVRAVFAGDYGPLKFSHTERDGIHYLQTSLENEVDLEMLRMREESRLLSAQLDNFVLVSVRGGEVRFDVRTVAALSSGKFAPERYRQVAEVDKWSLGWRLRRKWSTPARLLRGVALVGAAGFAAGAVLVLLVHRLGRGRGRR